ncbi:hypothetical protein N566_21165 [Streptomycetaceae bacterium MP113-05]|nr:hypothetical protein N566_21165 [Streptomycetaceae bacterium MP113-05]
MSAPLPTYTHLQEIADQAEQATCGFPLRST